MRIQSFGLGQHARLNHHLFDGRLCTNGDRTLSTEDTPKEIGYGVYRASCGVRLVVVEWCMKGSLRLT
ncbi:hypothetical protein PVK06_022793 [Gossypium arboreum]|uniref:Uncharacterized protein n=1 Tax=Gossypium arboreum TaxID=29729 RepID=A0ABR0P9J4_GOSAR|nr:hypothetical protein PVK06_022793 [Gossypium arboreum]